MKGTYLYGPGKAQVDQVAEPSLKKSTDAIVKTVLACICGSDLWDYVGMSPDSSPVSKGHELIGVVESIGSDVKDFNIGDLVVVPFVAADNTCDFCREGLQTSCRHIEFFGGTADPACQAEKVRIPHADGTMVKLPVEVDSPLLPSLLTLSDVMCTGHHAAVSAGVQKGDTVTVVGDGAVGLCAVIAAKRLGAGRIILMGRHEARTDLGIEFGATDVVAERGAEGIAKVRELTGGDGTPRVLECVGTREAIEMSIGVVRDGGTIGRVGAAQYKEMPLDFGTVMRNVNLSGGVAPARAYIDELMVDVLNGSINPGRVFDMTVSLDDIAKGYKAMADRTALKVLVRP